MRVDGGAPLTASLNLPPTDIAAATVAPTMPRPAQPEPKPADADGRRNTAAMPVLENKQPAADLHGGVAAHAEAALTQPSDPTYYGARSLDVYPKALTPLQLDVQSGAAKVRATVFIDEAGYVNEVRAIEASPAAMEEAARELLLRARFTPASKDGRIVKAQVRVSLE